MSIDSADPGERDGRATRVTVDALGELAAVDGMPLMWDSADPFSPLTWMDASAVVGHGSPWALAGAGCAQWLAPDWQGTVGDGVRDPWGALQSVAGGGSGLQLGYRGELEFDGESWLRNRSYEPASRSFLQPDRLPAVPGTACATNPYHYAGSNPIGLSDPLGLRPITDAELQKYRDQMGRRGPEQLALLGQNLDGSQPRTGYFDLNGWGWSQVNRAIDGAIASGTDAAVGFGKTHSVGLCVNGSSSVLPGVGGFGNVCVVGNLNGIGLTTTAGGASWCPLRRACPSGR